MGKKVLCVSDAKGAKTMISDLELFGDGDAWKLICKASSDAGGWMRSTKAMEIPNDGVIVNVSTVQYDVDGKTVAIAEAIQYVPDVCIREAYNKDGSVRARYLVPIDAPTEAEAAWIGGEPLDIERLKEQAKGLEDFPIPFETVDSGDKGDGTADEPPTLDKIPPEGQGEGSADGEQGGDEMPDGDTPGDEPDGDMTGRTTEIG